MIIKKMIKGILKFALFIGTAAVAYSWGKDDGYEIGFKGGYKAACSEAFDALDYILESEGNTVPISKKTKGDVCETS